jgi:hypothetical protein
MQVGIDVENVPSCLKFVESLPSTIQLATHDRVFIVDLLTNELSWAAAFFDRLVKQLLENDAILKLGLGLENDLVNLKRRFGVKEKVVNCASAR